MCPLRQEGSQRQLEQSNTQQINSKTVLKKEPKKIDIYSDIAQVRHNNNNLQIVQWSFIFIFFTNDISKIPSDIILPLNVKARYEVVF